VSARDWGILGDKVGDRRTPTGPRVLAVTDGAYKGMRGLFYPINTFINLLYGVRRESTSNIVIDPREIVYHPV
jgi:hypothetical protein